MEFLGEDIYGAHIFLICLSLLPFLVCHDHPGA
jgi:hypothetical protein